MADSNAIIDDLINSGATEFGKDEVNEHIRMQYVPCEVCGGTGETVISVGPHQCDTSAILCSACDGYGIECVPHESAGIEHTED